MITVIAIRQCQLLFWRLQTAGGLGPLISVSSVAFSSIIHIPICLSPSYARLDIPTTGE